MASDARSTPAASAEAAVAPRPVRLLRSTALRPTEKTLFDRLESVLALLLGAECWTYPIRVEEGTLSVMDGHHRLAVSRRLGLIWVPGLAYRYSEVTLEATRDGYAVSPGEVIRRGLAGDLYQPKTTRHRFR